MLHFVINLVPWPFLLICVAIMVFAARWLRSVQRIMQRLKADVHRLCQLIERRGDGRL